MASKIKNIIVLGVILLSCSVFVVSSVNAKMGIPTQLVSGTITAVKDGVIELDGEENYHPVNMDKKVSLATGKTVTIRYVTSPDGTKKYVEIAPGLDTLSPEEMPSDNTKSRKQ